MLTPSATRWRTGSPCPMALTCVSTGRSPETQRFPPRRLNATPTPTFDRREAPPAPRTGVVLRARLLRPAGPSRRCSSSLLFNPASDARLRWGRVQERHRLMARRSSAGQHRYIAAIAKRPWAGTSGLGPGRQGFFPNSRGAPHCPPETSREQVREAQARHPFGGWGLDRSPVAARRGPGWSAATVPLKELDDLAPSACFLS